MNIKHLNESFKKQYEGVNTQPLTESFASELKDQLNDAAMLLSMRGSMNIKDYEIAFQETIENMEPDKAWWEVTDLNIFYDLFENRDIDGCIERIITNLKPEYSDTTVSEQDSKAKEDVEESLEEAANPDNEEINSLIRAIVNGDSRAYAKLRKLGYDVEVDDSARKQFGKDYFGKSIKIINRETGRQIIADPGHRWSMDDSVIARPVSYKGSSRNTHIVKAGRHGDRKKEVGNRGAFDYRGYLDKPIYDDSESVTTVQQYKADKRFLSDNEFTIRKGKEAEARMADIRSKLHKEGLCESFDADEVLLNLIKEYDEYCDTSVDFESDLYDFVEHLTIYSDDCVKWLAKDPRNMFQAGMAHCEVNDSYTKDFDDFVRGAIEEIVFGFRGKFEEIYNQHETL